MSELNVGRGLAGAAAVAVALLVWTPRAGAQHYSEWSAPVSLGSAVNTASTDGCPFIAKSDLTLFLASNRPGGHGGLDLYLSQRDSKFDPWETPQNLGDVINGPGDELCPTLSIDGRHLFLVSNRAGGCGGQDLYVATRRNKRDDFGWSAPVNLGCVVNSPFNDFTPSLFEDERSGELVLFFSSNRPGGPGGTDIYSSRLDGSGTFGPATLVWELSTSADDQRPNVRRDGLEIFFDSNRAGSLGGSADLWTATRESTSDTWSIPTNLGEVVNTTATEGRPSLSFDAQTLYFMSSRAGGSGGLDLYAATRERRRGAPSGLSQ